MSAMPAMPVPDIWYLALFQYRTSTTTPRVSAMSESVPGIGYHTAVLSMSVPGIWNLVALEPTSVTDDEARCDT
eukprot:831766-Rhodomonas_salina.3